MSSNDRESEVEELNDGEEHVPVNSPDLLSHNQSCSRLLGPAFDKLAIVKIDGNWTFTQKEIPFVKQPVRLLECFQGFLFYIGKGSRKVVVVDVEDSNTVFNDIMFDEEVQGITFRSPYIFFILQERISIYEARRTRTRTESHIRPYHEIKEIRNLTPNTVSVGRRSQSEAFDTIIACHSFEASALGELQLYSLQNKATQKTIQAHECELSCIAINLEATKIATASQRGTLVRIFNHEGVKLYEYRRGMAYASIKSLIFCPMSKYLACTSDRGTIHIFKFKQSVSAAMNTWSAYLTGFVTDSVTSTAKYVTQGTSAESLFSDRSFATVSLTPGTLCDPRGVKTHGFVADSHGNIGLLVSHYSNIARIFRIDQQNGGVCKQYSQFTITVEK